MYHVSALNLIIDFHEIWCEIVPLVENPKPYLFTIKSRSIYVILLHALSVGCLYRVFQKELYDFESV
jgi:hypothetical protein